MKTMSIYLTVRVDVDMSDGMDVQDALSTAVENFNMEVSLPENTGMSVSGVDICDVNEE